MPVESNVSGRSVPSGMMAFHVLPASHLDFIKQFGLQPSIFPLDDGQERKILLYESIDALDQASLNNFGDAWPDHIPLAIVSVNILGVETRPSGFEGISYAYDPVPGPYVISKDLRTVTMAELRAHFEPPRGDADRGDGGYVDNPAALSDVDVVPGPEPLTYERWEELFKPLLNNVEQDPGSVHVPLGNIMGVTETSLRVLENIDPRHIWTRLDVDGMLYMANGFHRVNRDGYFVCQNRWQDGAQIEFEYDPELNDLELPFDVDRSGDGPNTAISYMYRDAGNNKTRDVCVLEGRLSGNDIRNFADSLTNCDDRFDPMLVDMDRLSPAEDSGDYIEDLDHYLHEVEDIRYTDARVTHGTAEDFARCVRRVDRDWTHLRYTDPEDAAQPGM